MTKLFEAKLFSLIERVIRQVMEQYNEEWVDAKGLTQNFACLTANWLKDYGQTLPRTQATVTNESTGESHSTRWMYPKNRIQRMMMNGEIKNLTIK